MISVSDLPEYSLLSDWHSPVTVHSFCTTRLGGVSKPPFDQMNLGLNAGDEPQAVLKNRAILTQQLPSQPTWLRQVHGTEVSTPILRNTLPLVPIVADAIVSDRPGEVLAILTADCMPVLFTSVAGDVIGAAHAGWKGLSGGVLENTVQAMLSLKPSLTPQEILVWVGPAIGPAAFEVGADVLDAFSDQSETVLSNAFIPIPGRLGKYWASLEVLAEDRLRSLGILSIAKSGLCTYSDPQRFYSYRRDGVTGRFASLIWIAA
jgi:YfiH family protein